MSSQEICIALQKLPLADKGIGPAGFAFSWI
jgi:hypothetical protein